MYAQHQNSNEISIAGIIASKTWGEGRDETKGIGKIGGPTILFE